ncbi:hypothetical protein ID0985_09100 [Helicobacter pylori]
MPKDNNKEPTLLEKFLGSRIEVRTTLPKQTLDSNYQYMILIRSNELYQAIR